jgi:HAD superfamily hydrolase (TIGR01484 family)
MAALRGLICDIDGTLTTNGRLTATAYAAMERVHKAGLLVVPVTGRPAGWCDMIARFWPVAAVVGENGAFYFRYDHAARRMTRGYLRNAADRARDRERMHGIAEDLLRRVPGCALAADQPYRETDLAIDYREDVPPLPLADARRIAGVMDEHGMNVKISSIHVNGWFGAYDKLAAVRRLLRECFDIDLDRERERFVFVGDSPNDEPMFEFFPYAAAVANVSRFMPELRSRPSHVTRRAEGAGFTELVREILPAIRAAR